ncbi:MAG: energy transducer TonB [Prevotellaceae bacterium]|jgi:TonB family protein|nr:energy transducer TonB [Prevotellaceae bacterium]
MPDPNKRRQRTTALLTTIGIHLLILLVLVSVGFTIPIREEESGVSVMLGDNALGSSGGRQTTYVPVQVATDIPKAAPASPTPAQPLITGEEETVALSPKEDKPAPTQTPEQIKAQEEAEARRIAAERAEAARRAAAETANRRVSDAFGKGTQIGATDATNGEGVQGTLEGTETAGALTGGTGYGSFDLGGRSLRDGTLPRPAYEANEEAIVVVSITVNQQGDVVGTSIDRRTNTVNATLRNAAEDAARRAKFNTIGGLNNQTGSITYYFRLR